MEPIKVLVVDDHTLFREGLSALLTAAPETTVSGEAGDGRGCSLPAIRRLDPNPISNL